MSIWPFKPRETVIEALEWKTDVIRAKNAEQRFSLRRKPRRSFNLTHTLTQYQYTSARALIRADEDIQMPEWPLSINIGSVSSGSSVSIVYTQTDLNLSAGDTAILWESIDNYESVTIESIDSNGCVLTSVLNNYTSARFMPLHTVDTPGGLTASRPAGPRINVSIEMIVRSSNIISDSDYASYRSHDLVNDCPVVAESSFNEPILWPVDVVDNVLSRPRYFNMRNIPDARYMIRWNPINRAEVTDLREFLNSRRGRWKAFWLSSFGKDFELAQTIGSTDTTITVFASSGVTDLGATTFDIDVYARGVHYYRQVTSYASGSQISGRDTIVFTIDSQLGAEVTEVHRISYLRCLRFDVDRIEINHRARGGNPVAVAVIEIDP